MASRVSTKIFPRLWYAKEAEKAARSHASIFPDSRVDRVGMRDEIRNSIRARVTACGRTR